MVYGSPEVGSVRAWPFTHWYLRRNAHSALPYSTGDWTSAHDRLRMINIHPRACCVPDPVCTEKTHDRSCAQERGHGSPRYRNQIDKPVWRIGNAR